jgi:glyoxylase-like metal-dependent hydrolase (beta-lactamase superfamily II)
MKIELLTLGIYQANCYVVSEGENCFIVDPGERADKIKEFLQENHLTPRFILLTHGHLDHVGAVDELMDDYMIETYMSPLDKRSIDKGVRIFGKVFHDTTPVEDGDEIVFQDKIIKVIATPGHTLGGLCFLVDNHLFSGDTLFRSSVGRTDLEGGSHESLVLCIKTKLMSLPEATIVYPGHNAATTIGAEKINNPFLG